MRVKNQLLKNISLYLIILVVAAMVLRMNMPQEAKPAEWTYSTFIQNLDAGKVDNVNLKSVGNDNYEVIGETKDGKAQFYYQNIDNLENQTKRVASKLSELLLTAFQKEDKD
jgi:cell division protease FtsH